MSFVEERLLFCSIKGSWCNHDDQCAKCQNHSIKKTVKCPQCGSKIDLIKHVNICKCGARLKVLNY